MNDINKYSSANKVKKSIEKIALSAIERERPAPKTAQVKEINLIDKYAMVVYLGEPEDNIVRVPFNNNVPSYIGQWVRIGGTASDRKIEEIMGATLNDTTVQEHSERLAAVETIALKAYFEAQMTATMRTTPTVQRAPMGAVSPGGISGFQVEGTLGVRCMVAGTYFLYGEWKFTPTGFTGTDDCNLELECRTQVNTVFRRATAQINVTGSVTVSCIQPLQVGDFVCMNVWSGKWRDHGSGDIGAQFIRLGAQQVA